MCKFYNHLSGNFLYQELHETLADVFTLSDLK